MEIHLTYEEETRIRIRLELKLLAGMHCVIPGTAIRSPTIWMAKFMALVSL